MPPPLTETMYLRFSTKQEAKQLSADFWTRILGRPKNPQDTSEFLFRSVGCKDGGHDYLVLSEPYFSQVWPKLTPQEQNFLDVNMVPMSNVQVQNCLASIVVPLPP
jgi:hypothetical protein